eukprot:7346408-Prymnesium_polylepis.1
MLRCLPCLATAGMVGHILSSAARTRAAEAASMGALHTAHYGRTGRRAMWAAHGDFLSVLSPTRIVSC